MFPPAVMIMFDTLWSSSHIVEVLNDLFSPTMTLFLEMFRRREWGSFKIHELF